MFYMFLLFFVVPWLCACQRVMIPNLPPGTYEICDVLNPISPQVRLTTTCGGINVVSPPYFDGIAVRFPLSMVLSRKVFIYRYDAVHFVNFYFIRTSRFPGSDYGSHSQSTSNCCAKSKNKSHPVTHKRDRGHIYTGSDFSRVVATLYGAVRHGTDARNSDQCVDPLSVSNPHL